MNFSRAKKVFSLIAILIAALVFAGCERKAANTGGTREGGKKVIGFAQSETDNPWRIAETKSMQDEAAKRADKYEFVLTNAQGQTSKQVSDVEDLIARRVDAIFLVPREAEGLTTALQRAKEAKIPVFLIDREHQGTAGQDFVTFIGSNFVEEGQRVGEWVVKNTGGKAGVVVLEGNAGASVARDRNTGFLEAIKSSPDVKVLASQPADFKRANGQAVMENLIQAHGKNITVVYAHNDEMALGAIQALKTAGFNPGKDVKVVSVDGQKSALEAIIAGDLNVTVECNPRFGPIAFDTLEKYFAGQPIPPKIIVPDKFFDAGNAAQFVNEAY
ncbi:MAG TPA: ABC transporter substrate-binding protein [Pyrinomonadaceae bacterium]|jgi:ribose transport system substrate-binding protein